ncbi:MAG: hypothetical protein ACC631_12470, partial [Halocynthiibacter sp.]
MNDKSDQPETKPGVRTRRGLWMLLSSLLLVGLFVFAGLSLSGRVVNAPEWLSARVITRVNAALPGASVTLGRLQFQVDRRGIPRVLMGNLGIFDDRGVELARLNAVDARFSMRALLRGVIQPEAIRLTGAQMTLRRRADGQFDVSLGTGAAATASLAGVLDLLDQAFMAPPLDKVTLLDAVALTITLEDARSARLWQITEGGLQIRRADDGLDISVAFEVFNGTEELAETVMGIRTQFASSAVTIGTTFRNAASSDIAAQSPVLSFLGVMDAPISGSVRAGFDETGTLASLAGTLEIGSGALQPTPGARALRFDSGKSYFDYDPEAEKLTFSELSVVSETITAVASGQAYLREFKDG